MVSVDWLILHTTYILCCWCCCIRPIYYVVGVVAYDLYTMLIGLYCTRPIYYVVGVVIMFKFVLVQVGLQACLMHGAFLAVVSSNPIKGCVLEIRYDQCSVGLRNGNELDFTFELKQISKHLH